MTSATPVIGKQLLAASQSLEPLDYTHFVNLCAACLTTCGALQTEFAYIHDVVLHPKAHDLSAVPPRVLLLHRLLGIELDVFEQCLMQCGYVVGVKLVPGEEVATMQKLKSRRQTIEARLAHLKPREMRALRCASAMTFREDCIPFRHKSEYNLCWRSNAKQLDLLYLKMLRSHSHLIDAILSYGRSLLLHAPRLIDKMVAAKDELSAELADPALKSFWESCRQKLDSLRAEGVSLTEQNTVTPDPTTKRLIEVNQDQQRYCDAWSQATAKLNTQGGVGAAKLLAKVKSGSCLAHLQSRLREIAELAKADSRAKYVEAVDAHFATFVSEVQYV